MHKREIILKVLKKLNELRFANVSYIKQRCITENQYSRFRQKKFFFKDYISKPKYKEIAYQGEFQQELTFVLPFAYWHYMNGTLKETISSKDTKELYFFSKNHKESFEKRDYFSFEQQSYEIPNMSHNHSFSFKKWMKVPLKEFYKNDIYKYDKPILVIANKYNTEWNKPPVNYLSKSILKSIFSKYGNTFQIIYNRPLNHHIVQDNSITLEMEDSNWIRTYFPDVILMSDLFDNRSHLVNNYNHLQLLIYANCEHFISVHGGTAALASYFGGTNIILSKSGLEHYFKEYETIFPALSGAKILHAKEEEEILTLMHNHNFSSIKTLLTKDPSPIKS